MRKLIVAAVAVAGLAACHLPAYGGKTEKNDIGCYLRGGATTDEGGGWFGCEGMHLSADSCSFVLSLDDRFTIDDRYVVCQYQGHNWVWGSRGFISDGH